MKKRICNWKQIIRLFISFPHIIFRMDQLPLYDIKHSKHVTVYLQQWKQLYTLETCLLSIMNNKTLGHMTPFMALLPLLDKKIVQTYPDMGAGGNGGLFYIPSSATVEQNPSYVQSGRLNWSSYSTQGQHLLIKEIIGGCSDYIPWHGDHFTETKQFDFTLSPRAKSLSKFYNFYPPKTFVCAHTFVYIHLVRKYLDTLCLLLFLLYFLLTCIDMLFSLLFSLDTC